MKSDNNKKAVGLDNKNGQFVRFCMVGVGATATHYVVFLLFDLWINVNVAYTIGYATSFICNYFLTSYYTFKTKPSLKTSVGFALSHTINWGMQLALLNIFMRLGMSENWAPFPTWCITIPIIFLLIRFFFKLKA